MENPEPRTATPPVSEPGSYGSEVTAVPVKSKPGAKAGLTVTQFWIVCIG